MRARFVLSLSLSLLGGCVDERAPIRPLDLSHIADMTVPKPVDLSAPPDLDVARPQSGTQSSRAGTSGTVTLGKPTVRGTMSAPVVERIVKRHLNELRFCYEKELLNNPTIHGSLTVQAVIANSGVITSAVVQNSTLSSPGVEECTTGAVRRWIFPTTGGGIAIVTYPIGFRTTP